MPDHPPSPNSQGKTLSFREGKPQTKRIGGKPRSPRGTPPSSPKSKQRSALGDEGTEAAAESTRSPSPVPLLVLFIGSVVAAFSAWSRGGLAALLGAGGGEACVEGWLPPDCLDCSAGYSGDFCRRDKLAPPQAKHAAAADGDCEQGWDGADCLSCSPGHSGEFCRRDEEQPPPIVCSAGTEATALGSCSSCREGSFDHDRDPATPCREHTRTPHNSISGIFLRDCLRS